MQNFEDKFYNFDDIYYDYPELYYSNGKIISHSKFKHPKNGIIKIHTNSGQVLLEICYKNNKKHGKCTHYFYNSDTVHLVEYYRRNKLIAKNRYKKILPQKINIFNYINVIIRYFSDFKEGKI